MFYRMQRHNENGLEVARYLEKHPKVKQVYYLGLSTHTQNSVAVKTMSVSIYDSLIAVRSMCIKYAA